MPEDKESSPFNWPGLLVLAAAAIGGLFWFQAPLRSSRPPSARYYERRTLGEQVVDARLWQDPFETVAAYQKAEKADVEAAPHSIAGVVAQICRRLTNTAFAHHSVLVSLQMVSGGPYLEDSESRLRSRNAVVSALGRSGYVPSDEEHIDYFTTPWPRGTQLAGSWTTQVPNLEAFETGSLQLTVPLEWFQPNTLHSAKPGEASPTNQVLVCWLPREAFPDHLLKRLALLLAPLRNAAPDAAAGGAVRFQLFDPDLKPALDEFQELTAAQHSLAGTNRLPAPELEALRNLEVYSSWSTSADALLAANATEVRRENIRSVFTNRHIAFTNVTATDDELAEKLLKELKLREVNLIGKEVSVALISEWDTYYGRALPLTFAAKLIQLQRVDSRGATTNLGEIFDELRANTTPWPANVWRFSYLRGVDGKLPGGDSGEKPAPAKSRKQELQDLERPEGCGQLDYMPRLAAELQERDRDAKREGKPPLRAIGILGSDVYDKLLFIQALRDRFPGALFFTVDLDARLFHPTELTWSRNLLVASSFDLELDECLQDPIPPFRDTYQTGKFLACLVALGQVTNDLSQIHAQIFEVGHHGAYVLGASRANRTANPFYSARPPPLNLGTFLACAGALALGFVLVLLFSQTLRAWVAGRSRSLPGYTRWIALGIALFFASFLWLIRCDHARPNGEPFTVFEGISAWPAELLRLAGVAISLGLLAYGIKALETNRARLAMDFHLQDTDANEPALPSDEPGGWFCRLLRRIRSGWAAARGRLLLCLAAFTKPLRSVLASLVDWIQARLACVTISLPGHPDTAGSNLCDIAEQPRPAAPREELEAIDASELWHHYERWGLLKHRLCRITPSIATFFALALLLMWLFGFPLRPCRGWVSIGADTVALAASVFTQVFLTFFVVDAVRACRRLTEELSSRPTKWPHALLTRFANSRNIDQRYLDEWLGLRLIAQRTRTVGKLVYFPFVMLALMLLSRNAYFDRWDWPLSLVVLIGTISLHALACAISLRQTAEKARKRELSRLNEKLLSALGDEDKHNPDQIRETIKDIESLREGAFAPLTQQPFFRAILLILGGAGSLPLAGYLPSLLGLTE